MTRRLPLTGSDSAQVLARLRELRAYDAPTHGGSIFAYVYDSGMSELDALAGRAAELTRPLNGLDPTTFPSVAVMERELLAFVRRAVNGHTRRLGGPVVGSITSGGTESCMLAVKTARDLWRDRHPGHTARPRLVAPVTAHAAFQKAAAAFDLEWTPVPCEPDGSVRASALTSRLGDDVALVVVSAPSYPSGAVDPIAEVSAAAEARGIPCHVDACFGGLILPWWPDAPVWDFRLPGVTSLSADLHKFGYAPKGVSVLLQRGRIRHRRQYFATTRWAGYPVVNATLLGSRSVSPLAAAWALTQRLGAAGYQALTASCERSVRQIRLAVDTIPGLAVMGDPVGPALALVADMRVPAAVRVDPHHLADAMARIGYQVQYQPGILQQNGIRLPHSAHLTVTPVTETALRPFLVALRNAADTVRGMPQARATLMVGAMRALGYGAGGRVPGPAAAWRLLRLSGAARIVSDLGRAAKPPTPQAELLALVEQLPPAVAEALLVELLARASEP